MIYLVTDFRGQTSTLGLVIFVAIRTLEHSIYSYFLSRNIICKKVTTLTANVLKSPARFSVYERSGYIAAFVIVSFFVDRPCSSSRFCNNSALNYNHLLYQSSFISWIPFHMQKLSNLSYRFIIERNTSARHICSSFLFFIFFRIFGFWSCIM